MGKPDFVLPHQSFFGRGVVSVDWWAMSCKLGRPFDGSPLVLPGGWQSLEMSSTTVWKTRIYILDADGNKVATFLTNPHSKDTISPDRAIIEIANDILYRSDFQAVSNVVANIFPMSIEGLNRVDLCCDFEMAERQWQIFRLLEDGQAELKGLKRGVVWWTKDKNSRIPHQISWGGKESVFHWKCYWKWKELHEGGVGCTKPYIEKMWASHNMRLRSVWRLEVSIAGTNNVRQVADQRKIPLWDWYIHRGDIFSNLYADKFVVRQNLGHADKRNDPKLYFLDIIGEKQCAHNKSVDGERESDAERRVVCKMWKEWQDGEVRANSFLEQGIREFLMYMFQKESNVKAICRRFKLTNTEVLNAFETTEKNCGKAELSIIKPNPLFG